MLTWNAHAVNVQVRAQVGEWLVRACFQLVYPILPEVLQTEACPDFCLMTFSRHKPGSTRQAVHSASEQAVMLGDVHLKDHQQADQDMIRAYQQASIGDLEGITLMVVFGGFHWPKQRPRACCWAVRLWEWARALELEPARWRSKSFQDISLHVGRLQPPKGSSLFHNSLGQLTPGREGYHTVKFTSL